jgi:hypothetical protein
MKRMIGWKTGVLVLLVLFLGSAASCFGEEKIQLAILLDTSSSMDGLIDQAKAQLWKVVNELARAERKGAHPLLEVAVFEYGNDGLKQSDGYIRMVTDLTTDLDAVSEKLFGLATNGGDEYCGMVIDRAAAKLSWSGAKDVLKVVFIAGNEGFDQGPVAYAGACGRAVKAGIIVNTVYCGGADDGVASLWKEGADRADGRYMSIDQNTAAVAIATPYDTEIVALGDDLNATYVAFGREGEASKSRQAAQDKNASSMSAESVVQRSVAKAQESYVNSGWDLLDALESGRADLRTLKDDELPAGMRSMTPAQKETYVKDLGVRRNALQKKINEANEKRRVYVAEAMKQSAEANTLEHAILTAVREEAAKKSFVIE